MNEMYDFWYEHINEKEIIILYEDENGKEWELAHISIEEEVEQEDLYNYCLEIANSMGYYLLGQLE